MWSKDKHCTHQKIEAANNSLYWINPCQRNMDMCHYERVSSFDITSSVMYKSEMIDKCNEEESNTRGHEKEKISLMIKELS